MSKITLTGFALLYFCFSETAQEIMQLNPNKKTPTRRQAHFKE